MTERQKAKYRLLVFGLVAVLGPPAFGMRSVFAILYSVLLVVYALWALRLTVVFHDDSSLGYLLCLFDAAIVVPLLLWGSSAWLAVPVALLWAGGLFLSIRAARRLRAELEQKAPEEADLRLPVDQATGFGSRAGFVRSLRDLYAERGDKTEFALVVVKLQRYQELALLCGAEAAGRALGAIGRRVQRVLGAGVAGFRITDDRVVIVLQGNPAGLPALIAEARRTAGARLVEGHKLEVLVGYARYPADGSTPRELLISAESSAEPAAARAAVLHAGSRLAMGS